MVAGRQWIRLFEQAYSEEHLHDGINFVTPAPQHQGVDTELIAKYEAVYQRAKNLNPKRWSGDIRHREVAGAVSFSPEKLQEIERKKTGCLSAAIWKTGLQITANRTPHEVSLNFGELFHVNNALI
jgi:hypothetical protein